MASDIDVLLHHSASTMFGSDLSDRIQMAIETDVTEPLSIEVAETPIESAALVNDSEVVVTIHDISDLLNENSDVRWIQTLASGVDSWDLDMIKNMEILLTNASGVAAEPIAQQVLGYMLTFERQIDTAIRRQENEGVWRRYSAGELTGKTVGIIGVGAIGSRVAELATAFGMRVVGTKKTPSTAPETVDEIYSPDKLDMVLFESDYVVIACPLVEETRQLLSKTEFGLMNRDAVLINVARGEIVDESALEKALQHERIRGAALDVFETEPLPPDSILWDLTNAILTPHMAGSTPKYAERTSSLIVENFEQYLNGDINRLRNRIV